MGGAGAAGPLQLAAERRPCPVQPDAGVPGRDAEGVRGGRDVGPAEVDAADEVGVFGLEERDEVVDARADGPLQVGVEPGVAAGASRAWASSAFRPAAFRRWWSVTALRSSR